MHCVDFILRLSVCERRLNWGVALWYLNGNSSLIEALCVIVWRALEAV